MLRSKRRSGTLCEAFHNRSKYGVLPSQCGHCRLCNSRCSETTGQALLLDREAIAMQIVLELPSLNLDFTGGCRPQIQLHLGLRPPDPLQLGDPHPSNSLQRMQQRNQVSKPLQEFGERSSLCRALGRSLEGAEGLTGATPQRQQVRGAQPPGVCVLQPPWGI